MLLIAEQIDHVECISEEKDGKKNLYIQGVFMESGIQNKNGRIYSRNIMEKAMNTYVDNYVKQRRAYGELNHPCFSPSAKAMTPSGWKFIKDLVVGEDVYTLNLETGKVEVHPIQAVHDNPFQGNMLRFKNRTFDTLVTPYHKMLVQYRDGTRKFLLAKDIKEAMDAGVAKLAKFCIPRTGDFDLPDAGPVTIGTQTIDFNIFVAFLGIYLAEGYTTKVKTRNNSYRIGICQNAGLKADKIRDLLAHTPWHWGEEIRDNKITFMCYNRDLAKILIQYGKSHEKFIDPKILEKMNGAAALEFLTHFHLGDGRGKIGAQADVFTVSERLADDLSVVIARAGFGFSRSIEIIEHDVIIENRVIKAGAKRPLHLVQILTSSAIYLDARHLTIEEVPYDGRVYCITVPNSSFLVSDNGKCFWSGNCGPTINLDRVSHMIESLQMNSQGQVIGRARIVDTPMGNIARGLMECGANLGVSTRGLGSIKENQSGIMEVQDDFRLVTAADIVADPSAPNAFVKGIMEGVEFFYDEKRGYVAQEIKAQAHKMNKRQIEENAIRFFEDYLKGL